jgi:purine-binding chemotaxis protein CheW
VRTPVKTCKPDFLVPSIAAKAANQTRVTIMSKLAHKKSAAQARVDTEELVTFTVGGQLFGVPVCLVQEVLLPDAIAIVPAGPSEVHGLINLRGRIVTVIDIRARLGIAPRAREASKREMGVTVEDSGESYALLVDSVGDVISLPCDKREPLPAALDGSWKQLADGVFRLESKLLVALNISHLLTSAIN